MSDPRDLFYRQAVRELIQTAPYDDGAYVRAADLIDQVSAAQGPEFRLAILRSFTIEPLVEILKVRFFLEGFRLELFLSEFNQYPQEILDPSSRLYRFKPALTFLAVRLEELCPRLWQGYPHLKEKDLQEIETEISHSISSWVETLARHSATQVLLSNFLVPRVGDQGLYDTQTPGGQISFVRAINQELLRLCQQFPQLHLFDLEGLASRIGKENFCDPLQWYRMSSPYALKAYPVYGEYLLCHIQALMGPRRKCLVLDLDNTLWGGLIGEEGPEGVELSDHYPGNCFKDFQRSLLALSQRGVLLAVNSKNHEEDGLAMFRSHPHMVLKEEHLSAIRMNWKDKAENLVDIAGELNLGLEALVFMDDSPSECERIRQAHPEVLVVELPEKRHLYRELLENLRCFDQLTVTSEDLSRVEGYRDQSQRKQLKARCGTLEEFYASLQMQGVLYRNDPTHIPRIAQMTQKTNQFNLTTHRYNESQIAQFLQGAFVYSFRMSDRFGDNGIVAVSIAVPGEEEWVIDSFLMSCRVILRTVEDTLLARIAEEARAAGVKRLVGRYLPTARNRMVKDFYPQRGFTTRPVPDSAGEEFVLELGTEDGLKPSPWIRIIEEAESHR